MITMKELRKAAATVRRICGKADIGIVLGSGLGGFDSTLIGARRISYSDIPGFPVSTVEGHAGEFAVGTLRDKRVMIMSGRFHSYEGYSMDEVTMPVRVMALLGVKTLILTNAAGGVNTGFNPGDLMLITDYINLSGRNPLRGPNMDAFGPRFPDMTDAYTPELRALALEKAAQLNIPLQQGVYCWMNGPTYETPAEVRMARLLGADAVGMSTVPETIVARHSGMRVLGISTITNMAAGVLDAPINHEDVLAMGERTRENFTALLEAIVDGIRDQSPEAL